MSEEDWTSADDVVEETRQVRRQLWARFGNDPEQYMRYMQGLHQQLLREGWKEAPPPPRRGKSAA
jgi:hypothetical protein